MWGELAYMWSELVGASWHEYGASWLEGVGFGANRLAPIFTNRSMNVVYLSLFIKKKQLIIVYSWTMNLIISSEPWVIAVETLGDWMK